MKNGGMVKKYVKSVHRSSVKKQRASSEDSIRAHSDDTRDCRNSFAEEDLPELRRLIDTIIKKDEQTCIVDEEVGYLIQDLLRGSLRENIN